MTGSIGPLLPEDEFFNHQVVETFATVGTSDPAWAEKVCGMAASINGAAQICFGFGKYTNRNVVDAYAGISIGKEQWTIRASRALHTDPHSINVGPIAYEVIEPLKRVKISLAANEQQPISFEIFFEAVIPCVMEDREDRRDSHGFRKATDQLRYHQLGRVEGWFEVKGYRQQIHQHEWVSTRDHSWGVRPSVGVPMPDGEPDMHQMIPQVLAIWNPVVFTKPDGSHYGLHHYYLHFGGGGFSKTMYQGAFEGVSGKEQIIQKLSPTMTFSSPNKRLEGGVFDLTMADGSQRSLSFEPLTELGFYLGAGHYHGGDGHYHGSWRGEYHIDSDYVADNSDLNVIQRYGQFRDCMIKVYDHTTGCTGYGNCQTYVHGAWLQFGLDGSEPML
jgi:hypothetical protein